MNKKGFTLMEVLGVLVILAVIFSLTVPVVNNVIGNSKETAFQKKINDILTATYDWSLEHINKLPSENKILYITLNDLKKDGLIDESFINPISQNEFSNDLVISISNVGGNYKYSNKYAKQGGDYLYKVELELMNDKNYDYFRPSIELEGISTETYTIKYNLGSEYTYPSYTATDKNGYDISSRVVITTTFDGIMVNNIDTMKLGIYYVTYTVVDEEGYSNSIVKNIIIVDEEAPVLILPENETIDTTVTSYDLMSGVSCTDNSKVCNISTVGTINYGMVGKYVIEYIAKDETGNTTTKKRVITIE